MTTIQPECEPRTIFSASSSGSSGCWSLRILPLKYIGKRKNPAAAPLSPIARLASQDLSVSGHRDLFSGSGGLFPQLFSGSLAEVSCQPVQDSSGWQGKRFPIRVVIAGRRTRIRCTAVVSQVQGPFTFSNFLRSFVFHVPINVMERIERYGKAFGDLQNVRRTSSVRNSSTEDRASWPLPVGSRTHTPRLP